MKYPHFTQDDNTLNFLLEYLILFIYATINYLFFVVDEEKPVEEVVVIVVPDEGTVEWIQYWHQFEGHLPTPIDVSITGSMLYRCPELKWYNFDVYPHKVKITNTGYTGK